MSKTDGGPAYPVMYLRTFDDDPGAGVEIGFQGMTLRDWFAGRAMARILTNAETPWSPEIAEVSDDELARAAYARADAMLAERSKSDADT